MFRTQSNRIKKQQRLFLRMSLTQLSLYCQRNPSDSLAQGIVNMRFQKTLDLLQSYASHFDETGRRNVKDYAQMVFTNTPVIMAPHNLQGICKSYATCQAHFSPYRQERSQSFNDCNYRLCHFCSLFNNRFEA